MHNSPNVRLRDGARCAEVGSSIGAGAREVFGSPLTDPDAPQTCGVLEKNAAGEKFQ
jgi:hypothetical protein